MVEIKNMTEMESIIIKYVRKHLAKGKQYYKSKHMAQELSLTSKCIGSTLAHMQNKTYHGLRIIKYSRALATTWKVERVKRDMNVQSNVKCS